MQETLFGAEYDAVILAQIKPLVAADALLDVANAIMGAHMRILAWRLAQSCGAAVLNGPFTGLRCDLQHLGIAPSAKLLGSYEAELHAPIADILERDYRTIINIGCGDGYYAVGFARRLPSARVLAFDIDPVARGRTQEMIRINEVGDRVTIGERCTHETLRELAGPHTLIFCDIEGDELELLQRESVGSSSVIVEFHDSDQPVSMRLAERFSPTHQVQTVRQSPRDANWHARLAGFSEFERAIMLCEFRGDPMLWGIMLSQ